MKRTVPLFFICCTVLATAAGFLLPGFLSAAQDSSIQTKEYAYETDSIRFHPVAQIEDSLQLMSGGHAASGHAAISNFPKDSGKLDADGAHRAALEAFRFLKTNGAPGIVSDGYSTHIETPFLAVSSDDSKSAVIWECEFYHNKGGDIVYILIDDNSGKMLAFRITAGHGTIWGKGEANNEKRTLDYLSKIISLYFGWKYGKIHMDNEFKGTITLIDPSGKALAFPIQISNSTFTFNGVPLFIKTSG